jgi:hypothetical protein
VCGLVFDITPCVLQRVKVYRLNDEGKWDDKGTGHVSVEYLEVIFLTLASAACACLSDSNTSFFLVKIK